MTKPSTSGHSKWVMIVFWPVIGFGAAHFLIGVLS